MVRERMPQAVTLRMVAERLGVSVQTVSNALQNTGRVSPKTAERVRQAAAEMGYRPNAGARALRGASTRTLAFILCDSVLTSTPSAYLGFVVPLVASSIRDAGYHPLIQFSDTADIDNALLPVRQGTVDGAILLSNAMTDPQLAALAAERTNVLLFERTTPQGSLPFVTADYAGGIAKAVHHVHSRGARRIAYLDGRPHWPSTSSALRFEGFNTAMDELGLQAAPALEGNWRFESGISAFLTLLTRGPLPDAVVCANDQMAVGLLRAAQDHGLRVPEDLMVTGFDDLEFARYTTPQLTSVRLPLAEMSAAAARRVVAQVTGKAADSAQGEVFPTELIVRASSARS